MNYQPVLIVENVLTVLTCWTEKLFLLHIYLGCSEVEPFFTYV